MVINVKSSIITVIIIEVDARAQPGVTNYPSKAFNTLSVSVIIKICSIR